MYTTGTNGLPSTSMLWLIQQHLKHHIQMAMLKHATLASIQTGLLNTNFRLRRHRLHTHNSALHNCSSTAIQSQLHSDAKWHQILGTRVVTITSSISQALSLRNWNGAFRKFLNKASSSFTEYKMSQTQLQNFSLQIILPCLSGSNSPSHCPCLQFRRSCLTKPAD